MLHDGLQEERRQALGDLAPNLVLRRELWRQQPLLALLNVVVGSVVSLALVAVSQPGVWLAWGGVLLASQALRLGLWYWYEHAADRRLDVASCARPLVISVAASGAAWGSLALFQPFDLGTEASALVIVAVIGMAGASISVLSAQPTAALAFIVLTLSPHMVLAAKSAPWFALLMLLFGLNLALAVWHLHRSQRRMADEVALRRDAERRALELAFVDPLTGLSNRMAFKERLDHALAAASDNGVRVAIALIDIDHFKQVNDTLGHFAGDAALRGLAKRLRLGVRKTDMLARFGGDEFVAVFSDIDSIAEGIEAADRIHAATAGTIDAEGSKLDVTLSIGLAVWPDHGATADALLRQADAALYSAKAKGRSRTELASRNQLERDRPSDRRSNTRFRAPA